MDLRPYLAGRDDLLREGIELIQAGKLWYQPFILAEGVEVGEGQNIVDGYRGCESLYDWNVSLSSQYRALWQGSPRKLAVDPVYFSKCNERYRLCYKQIVDTIASRVDLSSSSILEVGCNTGQVLFWLATLGAQSCVGVDWTDYRKEFSWLNRTLGTNVKFMRGRYHNIKHRLTVRAGRADVVVNTVFLNHQSDLLHCLSYLADQARKGLFLWILLNDHEEFIVRYGALEGVHDFGSWRYFPESLHNDVSISRPFLIAALGRLGFGRVEFMERPATMPETMSGFWMVYAHRTERTRSALTWPPAFQQLQEVVHRLVAESARKCPKFIKAALRPLVRPLWAHLRAWKNRPRKLD